MGTYVFRLLCCAVVCGILLSLFPEGRMKGLFRLFAGIFLTVTLLRPEFPVSVPELTEIGSDYLKQGRAAAAEGEMEARQQRHRYIKETLEAYILDKAEAIGCRLSVQVELDRDGCPEQVILSGKISGEDRRKLERILTEELGIAKEEQHWNGQEVSGNFTQN